MSTDVQPAQANDRAALPAVGSVVVLAAFMATLDATVVTVAINTLSVTFQASLATVQWATTAYTLALATVIPLTRWAAGRLGTKRVYLAAIAAFLLGSALAGTAWSIESLIVFRVLQGLGGGMIMPVGMIILTEVAGPERIGRVMGVLGLPMLLGPILGPLLAGWLVQQGLWRWIFYINLPIGLAVIAFGLRILPPGDAQPADRLDWRGLLMLSPGLAALLFGLTRISGSGLDDVSVLLPGGAGIVLIGAFIARTLRATHPLIELTLFANRAFAAAATAIALFGIAFFGATFLLPLFYQNVRGASPATTGLLMAAQGIGALLAMPLAGLVADRIGPSRVARTGIVAIAAGMAGILVVGAHGSYPVLDGVLFVLGAGMGMTMMPMVSAALKALTKADVPTGSTVLNIVQQTGSSIGVATMSVILAVQLRSGDPRQSLPRLHAEHAALVAQAFHTTLMWSLILIAAAMVPALFLPSHRRTGRAA